jgi:hypothetical protein
MRPGNEAVPEILHGNPVSTVHPLSLIVADAEIQIASLLGQLKFQISSARQVGYCFR